jgi:hypothetical protein
LIHPDTSRLLRALVGLLPKAGFEGQAAMALEELADPAERGAYPFPLVPAPSPATPSRSTGRLRSQ